MGCIGFTGINPPVVEVPVHSIDLQSLDLLVAFFRDILRQHSPSNLSFHPVNHPQTGFHFLGQFLVGDTQHFGQLWPVGFILGIEGLGIDPHLPKHVGSGQKIVPCVVYISTLGLNYLKFSANPLTFLGQFPTAPELKIGQA